jgi:TonB-linked SusC/RagA family outer membrane protein
MNRNITKLFITLLFLVVTQLIHAQSRTMSGVLKTEANSEAIVGASVQVKGTERGTITDENGKFSIEAADGETLIISSLGSLTKEIVIQPGESVLNVVMEIDENVIKEVVVTSFGITKEKRELSHAAQTVSGDDISSTQRENFLNALQGRIAGATVNSTSGAAGASSQIVLRGFNSLSGNNSPLIIVDGLPINNSVVTQGILTSDSPNRNDDYNNRAMDINPNDIESITVLKGPEAAALYGIDAGSGAIIITTKKGRVGGLKISYDNNFRRDRTYLFPELQTRYDLGNFGNSDTRTRLAFGAKIPDGTPTFDNLRNFFQDALTKRHNATLDGGIAGLTYRASLSTTNQEGTIPNTGYDRYNGRGTLNYASKNKKFDATATVAYTDTKTDKAFRGAGGFLQSLLFWPITDDARIYQKDNGQRRRFYDDVGFAEIDNPFWQVNKDKSYDKTERFNYNVSSNYKLLPWLTLTARGSLDKYETKGSTFYHPESNTFFTTGGQIEKYSVNYEGKSGVALATAQKKTGKIDHTLRVGSAVDDFTTKNWSERGQRLKLNADGQFIDDLRLIDSATYLNSRTAGRDTTTIRRLVGVFGEYTLSYDKWLNFNFAGRNDWTSTLPKTSRSFFYPSAGVSLIFSDLLFKNSKALSFGKLRASFAETAKDIQPYGSQSVYNIQLTSGGGYGYGFTNNNPFIVPERQRTFEVGTEMEFFNKRFGVDFSYYNTNNIGQIVRLVRLSYGTGFVLSTLNVADTRNRGLELVLTGQPIKTKNFKWNMTFNIAGTRNLVKNLPGNIPEYYNSDTWVSVFRNGIVPGGTTTTITGNDYRRNKNGDILVDPGTGVPLLSDPAYVKIGDRNPDLTGGFSNSFKYKTFSLSINTDFRKGGDIVNGTEFAMVTQGVSTRTLDREKPITVPGVLLDGLENTDNPTKNNIQIYPYNTSYYNDGRLYVSNFVEKDINWLRIREVLITIGLPTSVTRGLPILQGASVFASGTDLAIFSNYSGADPSVNANSGATAGIGAFGMDFFAPSTPRGINFGIRLNLDTKK